MEQRTFFICGDSLRDSHMGEDYDDILYVEDSPCTESILPYVNRMKDRLRKLWNEVKPDGLVVVYFDACSAFYGVLANLQIRMKSEEGIEIKMQWEVD